MDGSDRHMRDKQAQVGLAMNPLNLGAMMPNAAFMAAFLGDLEAFRLQFDQDDLFRWVYASGV